MADRVDGMNSVEDPGGRASIPVACTLTSADRADQADRWMRLADRALTARTETPDGLRLAFLPDRGVRQELRALAAVERDCCAWADWAVAAEPSQVVLTVSASGEGIGALHEMFRSLRAR